jgi:hypothetical protein
MEKYSYIEDNEIRGHDGSILDIEYRWVGKSRLCEFSESSLLNPSFSLSKIASFDSDGNPPQTITVGPYRLKFVLRENLFFDNGLIYIRQDYPLWRLVVMSYRARKPIRIFYKRLIYTAAIWGLAKIEEGQVISWRNIYILNNAAKTIEKIKNIYFLKRIKFFSRGKS